MNRNNHSPVARIVELVANLRVRYPFLCFAVFLTFWSGRNYSSTSTIAAPKGMLASVPRLFKPQSKCDSAKGMLASVPRLFKPQSKCGTSPKDSALSRFYALFPCMIASFCFFFVTIFAFLCLRILSITSSPG
jgi:hypothetical protein